MSEITLTILVGALAVGALFWVGYRVFYAERE